MGDQITCLIFCHPTKQFRWEDLPPTAGSFPGESPRTDKACILYRDEGRSTQLGPRYPFHRLALPATLIERTRARI